MGHALKRGHTAASRLPTNGIRMAARTTPEQPRYHTEIDDAYLDQMQRRVDEKKPSNFNLTPLGEPGW